MPCSTRSGHHPIHGIGYCANEHVNRFCSACYSAALLEPPPCKDCGGVLQFTTDDDKIRTLSGNALQKRLRTEANVNQQPSDRLPEKFAMATGGPSVSNNNAATTASNPAAEDLASGRWNAFNAKFKLRKAKLEIKDYPKGAYASFRKRYGLREPRETGYHKPDVAMRTAWRVSPVDTDATDAWRKQSATLVTQLGLSVGSIGNTVTPPSTVGYLCMVPLPMQIADNPLGDRHPVTLAEMYASAFPSREEAWKRLRLLLAVNVRDDFRYLQDKTGEVAKLLQEYVQLVNAALVDLDLPARAIGVLWGPTVVKKLTAKQAERSAVKPLDRGSVTVINLDQTDTPGTSCDGIRIDLAKQDVAKVYAYKPKATEFPFATVRSFLLHSAEASRMLEELQAHNPHVYLNTGDGDLVTLTQPGGRSLFACFDARFGVMTNEAIDALARAGGTTQFSATEVRQQIAQIRRTTQQEEVLTIDDKDGLALTKSILLTMLAKTVDTAVRAVVGESAPGAGYFAEPNSLINAKFVKDVKEPAITNENNKEMPDWASEINRRFASKRYRQEIWAELDAQVVTSSRSALVVVSDRTEIAGDDEIVRVGHTDSTVTILAKFANEHNTQMKDTQLNERFKEIGWGFASPVKLYLPLRSDYPGTLRLSLVPGVVARAVWTGDDADEVAAYWLSLEPKEELAPYFANAFRAGTDEKSLLAEMERFLVTVEAMEAWSVYQTLRSILATKEAPLVQTSTADQQSDDQQSDDQQSDDHAVEDMKDEDVEIVDRDPGPTNVNDDTGETGGLPDVELEDLGEVPQDDTEGPQAAAGSALVKVDIVFRWALGMISRIMDLQKQ